MKKKQAKAFSLVELLVAVSIFAVISIAVYSTFSSALTLLRKIKHIDLAQQRILLKQEKFSKDLRQAVILRLPLFLGAKDKISFEAIVDDLPCRVTYLFDNPAQNLMRNIDKLSDILTSEGKVEAELKSRPTVFMAKVKEVKFSYLYFDLKKNIYSWAKEWKENFLPLAVKLEILTEKQNYVTTVFLPTA